MTLTRADKVFYWLYWFSGHACGVMPYDWRADWRAYVRQRERGFTPWQSWASDGSAQS